MPLNPSMRDRWVPSEAGVTMDLPEGWGQGRSVFGGLTTAAGAALGHGVVEPGRTLRSVSSTMMRPVGPGRLAGSRRVLRTGRSATFVEVRLSQNGQECVVLQLVFVAPRPEAMRVDAPLREGLPDPEDHAVMPHAPGLMPEFVQHVEFRFVDGSPPFCGGAEARFGGYGRFRVPTAGAEGMLALLDLWPSPSLSMLSAPAPSSTVTWTAHLLETPDDLDAPTWFEYETVAGAAGFHTLVGRLYTRAGRLIGWTEQLNVVFA